MKPLTVVLYLVMALCLGSLFWQFYQLVLKSVFKMNWREFLRELRAGGSSSPTLEAPPCTGSPSRTMTDLKSPSMRRDVSK